MKSFHTWMVGNYNYFLIENNNNVVNNLSTSEMELLNMHILLIDGHKYHCCVINLKKKSEINNKN